MQLLSALRDVFRVKGQVKTTPPPPSGGTEPISFTPFASRDFGPGLGVQPSHETLLRENKGVPDVATRALANRVASLEPQVKVRRRVTAGTVVDEILDDHPLKALIDKPHPNITRWQLMRLTTQHIVTVGEAYWLKVGSRLGVPVELHPIPPTNIWPIVSQGVIDSYGVHDGDGKTIKLDAADVVRFYLPDPESPFEAEGYLGPAGVTVDSHKFVGEHLRSHYRNDATPPSVLESQEGATGFNPEDVERFNVEWVRRYHRRAGHDTSAPAILPLHYKLIQMALKTGADITPLLEFFTDEELMTFGVPKSLLGKVVSGDRSSAETNAFVFDLHAITPLTTLIADALTLQLAPDFDESIFVAFAPFVSDDKAHALLQENQDLTQKVRTINQVREDRALDPVEWGELPVGQIGQMPYDAMAYDLEMDDEGALGDEPTKPTEPEPTQKSQGKFNEGEAITASNVLNGAQVASIVQLIQGVGSGLLQKASGIELMGVAFGIDADVAAKIIGDPQPQAAVEPASQADAEERVRRWLGGPCPTLTEYARARQWVDDARAGRAPQLVTTATGTVRARGREPFPARASFFAPEAEWARQVKREKKYVPRFRNAMMSVLSTQKRSVLKKLEKLMPRARMSADDLFTPEEWVDLFEKKIEPVREVAFKEIIGETLGGLGLDGEFVFTAAMREALRLQAAQLVKHANQTTRLRIARALEVGTVEGEGVDQIAKRIRHVFAVRRKEARTIARTEMLKASQEAQLQGFETSGVVEGNRWNTSMDDAVRDSHMIDGDVKRLRQGFDLYGELADAPGIGHMGASLSAANSINCRCFLTPVTVDET